MEQIRITEDVVERISEFIKDTPEVTRYGLSRQVCEWIEWKGVDGRPKDMSCRAALLKLHRQGKIQLPEARPFYIPKSDRGKQLCAETKQEIKGALAEIGPIELVEVTGGSELSRQWDGLMQEHHYLGSGPLCGAQIRYLIKSKAGWLGGISFSGASWKLKDRDEWIGWSDEEREGNLQKVVCNSRFLILPWVKVPHLASHVLGQSARRLPADWKRRYGYEPVLLETFLEEGRFKGTSYRAANWQKIGRTQGRGRQDRNHTEELSLKGIYVYPLKKRFREELSAKGEPIQRRPTQPVVEPMDWAEEEFGGVELGDDRLKQRLLTLARDFSARPVANIPQACGSRAGTKAAYRFFENPETNMQKILKPHYEATTRRIRQHPIVLAVQDTTALDYSAHPATEGLGHIGTSKENSWGLLLHGTMAYNLEGTPLGLMDVQCWARDREDYGKKARAKKTPIERKESMKWLKSVRAAQEVSKEAPDVKIISVGDREADIYELFSETGGKVDLLVRAKYNRAVEAEAGHLWQHMEAQPAAGIQEVQIPHRGNRPGRTADMEVRYSKVTIKPPQGKAHMATIELYAVWSKEKETVPGNTPLQWMLLTTLPVESFEEACEKVRWYVLRWGIEVYHRTLKSGCKIENRQLATANSLESCLAIDLVVAWRIYHLMKLGREIPGAPCTVYFQDEEWKALVAYVTRNPYPPKQTPTLNEVIRMVATLGGFQGRKSDGNPGTQTLWLGIQRLDDITEIWKVMVSAVPQLRRNTVSSRRGCG